MPPTSTEHLLNRLDEASRHFAPAGDKAIQQVLARLAHQKFTEAQSLVRFHETLLFLSAYPQSARVKHLAESSLKSFDKRVAALREAAADLSPMDHPELSGIIGRPVTDTFTYPIVRWLVESDPNRVALDWEWFEDENRLSETWPRFMPLLEEDASVEANVPYEKWLGAASVGSVRDLVWLVERFESLPKTDEEKAELFDSQKLYVRWTPPYLSTRTGMRIPVQKIFYHREPLIERRDVSLKDELEKPPASLIRLSARQGEVILDMARAASTVRYRELYGFTHGDPDRVFKTSIGRGVDLFIMGLPPNRRLPLRAYHAALIFKNGVPVGYFEGLSLFERMESGFNLYYTFRAGETAWLYARTLNIFRHLLGVTAFTLDPYQIGYENEEGVESGAFWFYRKLGFRPTNPEVMKLVLREERKMAARPGVRTSAATLRKLAQASMIFELESARSRPGDWDRFQVRKIGLVVQRRMAERFAGDAEKFRAAAVEGLAREIGLTTNDWREVKLSVLSDFSVALSLIEDLARWNEDEKKALVKIIRAKASLDESSYLKLMQKHARLRSAMIKLGSQ